MAGGRDVSSLDIPSYLKFRLAQAVGKRSVPAFPQAADGG